MSLYVKDGRYKYEFTNFTHAPYDIRYNDMIGTLTNNPVYPVEKSNHFKFKTELWQDMKSQTADNIRIALIGLEESMRLPIETKKNDW